MKPFDLSKSLIFTANAIAYAVVVTLEICNLNTKLVIGAIAYLSKVLNSYEVNWFIRGEEFFAVVHILDKWRYYLLSQKFLLRTSYKSVKFIIKERNTRQRLMRRWNDITEFSFIIEHISGTKIILMFCLLKTVTSSQHLFS